MILSQKENSSLNKYYAAQNVQKERIRMNNQMRKNEIYEAIQAGERALTCLGRAQERLNSARNWGILDLFGGGFITDMVKHSRMNAAITPVGSL